VPNYEETLKILAM